GTICTDRPAKCGRCSGKLVPALFPVTRAAKSGSISGKITANPNPLLFGQKCVIIAWETNDPAEPDLHVATSPGEEKLVSRGPSGQTEIPWIADSIYDFRLYGASQPDTPIGSVRVTRDLSSASAILGELETAVKQGTIEMNEIAQFIAAVVPRCIQ